MVREMICLGVGLAIGGIAGWALGGKKCAKIYQHDIERLEYENAAYRKAQKEAYISEHGNQKDEQSTENVVYRNYWKEYGNAIFEDEDEPLPAVLEKSMETLSAEYQSIAFDQHMATRTGPTDDEEKTDPDDILMITEAEYEERKAIMEVRTYICYQEDESLTDDNGFLIPEEETVIGTAAAEKIYETQNDTIYAMDERADMLYEIEIQHNGSYIRDVLGGNY